jgi:transcriptional regulator with XRE-family HTH domain
MHRSKRHSKKITSWQVIGSQAAHFRTVARMTQAELAEALNISVDTVGSVEQGRRPLKLDLAERIDEVLETKGALAVAVEKVPERERFPAFAQDFVDHEQEAVGIWSYETQVVPGLLQTRDYSRLVFDCLFPPLDGATADEWVEARLDRQRVWERARPPKASFILEESILRRDLGAPDVLREQLVRLREFAELPHVGLQIMPLNPPRHAGLAGPVEVLETPEHDRLAYLEVQHTGILLDDPEQVSMYEQKYGMLRAQALSPWESADLLDDLVGAA